MKDMNMVYRLRN